MSIVKIHLYRSQTQKQQKYLLTYIPEIHSTIAQFLSFAIKALEIQHCTIDQLLVQNDGYILPHCLDGTVIKQTQLLTIKVKTNKKILPSLWTAQKIDQSQQHHQTPFSNNILSHIDQDNLDQSQSTPKFSEDGLSKQILSRKNSKQSKLLHKTQKQKKSQQIKKIKKVVQEVESSESSQQELVIKPKKKSKLKAKSKKPSFAKSSSSDESSQVKPIQSEESSEQESSELELPRVSRYKKVQMQEKVQSKKSIQKNKEITIEKSKINSSKSNQSSSKERIQAKRPVDQLSKQKVNKAQHKVETEINIKPSQSKVTYEQRKKIIEADDVQSSDSSSEEQILVKKVITQQKRPVTVQPAQPRMLPPALRNKVQHPKSPIFNQSSSPLSSFKKQQQQKWIPITKQIIEKYKNAHHSNSPPEMPFSQPNNLIRFKEIQLDEERFVPKTSEWIQATVERVESDGKLKLIKVTQFGREYRDRYDTYEHNMVEFQVNRDLLTKEQREVVMEGDQNQKTLEANTQKNQNESDALKQNKTESKQQNQKNSIQKFICGQVNYYFSDKNYQFDLFMQMHANKHPQKYIPIRFLLNFPKIKKVLKDEHKLFLYLVEDQRRSERNFEVDQDRKLVRKKIIHTQQSQQQPGKEKSLSQKQAEQQAQLQSIQEN